LGAGSSGNASCVVGRDKAMGSFFPEMAGLNSASASSVEEFEEFEEIGR